MKFDKTSNKLKPFLITFVIFILILTCFSAFMFMDSIDYDFDNIFEGKTIGCSELIAGTVRAVTVLQLREASDIQAIAVDANGDGDVNVRDCAMISRYIAGKEDLA